MKKPDLEMVEVARPTSEKLIRRAKTGAVRNNDIGRPRPDLISDYALLELGKLLANNSNTFGADNFQLGLPIEWCRASEARHGIDFGLTWKEYKRSLSDANDVMSGDEELLEKAITEATAQMFNVHAKVHTLCLIRDKKYREIHDSEQLISIDEIND